MIKGLRKKFILINMSLVTLVLFIVFTALYISNLQKYQSDSIRTLEQALSKNGGDLRPKIGIMREKGSSPMGMSPVFVVSLDDDGNIVNIDDSGISVASTFAQEAVDKVQDSGDSKGLLRSLSLRYMKSEMQDGVKIAFEDCSRELDGLQNLMIISISGFIGGLIAFFFISVFLSKWALGPVEKAWIQQRRFIADASHELKTPLTVILANLGILSSNKEDTIKNQVRWLENTQTEAARMKQLLDNLLFLAKSDTASVPVVFTEFDFSNTLWSCILPFESVAYEQQVTLKEEIEQGIRMTGDENQLKQLIAILLDNACKYAKKQGVVTVCLKRKPERADRIILEVRNTGDTIEQDDLEHIFERFYRSDKSRVRTQGGYGLGLAIAKTIVENHHGKINVKSSMEEGTVFIATFPGKECL